MLWINRSGAPWRDLPKHFGPWHRVYVRYNRWAHKGIWEQVFQALAVHADIEILHIDGTIARVHQHGAAKKTSEKPKAKVVHAAA